MKTLFVLMLLVLPLSSYGWETKVYTDQDLERYRNQSTYDEETILRRDDDLKRWEIEKQSEERLIREEVVLSKGFKKRSSGSEYHWHSMTFLCSGV
jgi:hypothetical protein